MVLYPSEMIPIFEKVVHEEFLSLWPDAEEHMTQIIQVRPFNLRECTPMRELDPDGWLLHIPPFLTLLPLSRY